MQGISNLRGEGPAIEGYNRVIGNRNEKENKTVTDIPPFIVGKKKFDKKVKQEHYTYPELEMNETGFKIESFVMEGVYRYPHNKEY